MMLMKIAMKIGTLCKDMAYVSSTGNLPLARPQTHASGLSGGRVNKFNVLKQARQYDPEGEFVRTWIPELARVPTERVHTPWLLSAAEARACGADAYFDSTHDLVAQQLPFYFGAMSAARKELVSQLADLEVQNSEVKQRQQQQRRCG